MLLSQHRSSLPFLRVCHRHLDFLFRISRSILSLGLDSSHSLSFDILVGQNTAMMRRRHLYSETFGAVICFGGPSSKSHWLLEETISHFYEVASLIFD